MDNPTSQPVGFQIVLGNRQLAAVLFMAIVLAGMLMTVAYLTGRLTKPERAGPTDGSFERKRAEQLIVVDPPEEASKPPCLGPKKAAGDTANHSTLPGPSEIAATSPLPPGPINVPAPPIQPSAGDDPSPLKRYLQVIAIDRPRADSFAAYLASRSLTTRVVPGPDENTYRVLVGPIRGQSEMARTRSVLEEAGLVSFERVY